MGEYCARRGIVRRGAMKLPNFERMKPYRSIWYITDERDAAHIRAGLEAAHEVRLAPRCRIDFMVGGVGVEIKKKRPQRAPLVAQLTRYAHCPQIARLIVLAPRGVDLPKSIGGKPVTMMSLEKLWGIMLP